jgi:hypothetical protein
MRLQSRSISSSETARVYARLGRDAFASPKTADHFFGGYEEELSDALDAMLAAM